MLTVAEYQADMMTQASAWLRRADIPTVSLSVVRL